MKTEDSNKITEVGPGTAMGNLLRQYWVPVMRSERLVARQAPVRFRMFGEDYVAFRGADGSIGVLDEGCPHRGASLAVANVEGNCVRCIYHGWRIDTNGALIEAPTHPDTARLDKVPTGSHPGYEDGGMLWAWLGQGDAPARPNLAFTGLQEDQVIHTTGIVNANWVQMLEGLWDTFHAQILHNRVNKQVFAGTDRIKNYFSDKERPEGWLSYDYPDLTLEPTDYGFAWVSDDEMKELNYAWIMPWFVHHTVGPDPLDDKAVQIHVPIDDEHTLFWQVMYNRHQPLQPDGYALRSFGGFDDLNDFRKDFTKENSWLQDRQAMADGTSFTGIADGRAALQILMEDIVMAESQFPLDRSKESLGTTDRIVVAGRKALRTAVDAFDAGGSPFGRDAAVAEVEAVFNPKAKASA
jgi:phenylpropionate dioxygenase-like ring-hydroxylating dioxygenase large terminal subunit